MDYRGTFARGFTVTPPPLVGTFFVVAHQPGIQIGLQLLQGGVDLLSEHQPVELIEHRFMKTLADPMVWGLFVLVPV